MPTASAEFDEKTGAMSHLEQVGSGLMHTVTLGGASVYGTGIRARANRAVRFDHQRLAHPGVHLDRGMDDVGVAVVEAADPFAHRGRVGDQAVGALGGAPVLLAQPAGERAEDPALGAGDAPAPGHPRHPRYCR